MSTSRSSFGWYLFIGFIALVMILAISQFVLVMRAKARLAAKLAELKAEGSPISLVDLKPPPIGDKQNAAAQLAGIERDLAAYEMKFLKKFEDTDLGKAWMNGQDQGELPTAEQLAAIKTILEDFPEVLPALHRAAECSEYASRADFSRGAKKYLDTTLSIATNSRSLARFVTVQMSVLTAEGKRDEAVRLGLDLLRVTRHHDAEPFQVAFLVSLAVRGMAIHSLNDALQRGPISAEVSLELDAELAQHKPVKQLGHTFQTERAYALTAIDDQLSGFGDFLHWPKMNWKVDIIDCHTEMITLQDSQWFEGQGKLAAIGQKASAAGSGPFRQQILGAFYAVYKAANRTTTELRCLRIMNALRKFSQQHGREATGLDELSLQQPETVDPFTGQPLKLKHTDKGWIVYSVMDNLLDDGGDFKQLQDWGVGPPGHGYVPEETEEDAATPASETPH